MANKNLSTPHWRRTLRRWSGGAAFAAALAMATLSGCANLETAEPSSACCDCFVEHKCTDVDRPTCGEWLYGSRSAPAVSSKCSDANGCSQICADAGVKWK